MLILGKLKLGNYVFQGRLLVNKSILFLDQKNTIYIKYKYR